MVKNKKILIVGLANKYSIAAGIAALKDDKHLDKIVSHNSKIKPWFIDNINKLGLKAYDSQANFIFVEVPKKKKQSAILLNNFLSFGFLRFLLFHQV